MKKGIHPNYHKVIIKMVASDSDSDSPFVEETFETYSTYGKEGHVFTISNPLKTHSAWQKGENTYNKKADKISDFRRKFGDMNME